MFGQYSPAYVGRRSKRSMVEDVQRELRHSLHPAFGFEKIANNTLQYRHGTARIIRLHRTDILAFAHDGTITLDSGGWQTVTTKERMNRYLPRGWAVWSERGLWTVKTPKGLYPFADGVKFSAAGEPLNPELLQDHAARVARDKKLIAAYLRKLKREGWADPAGDPWIAPDERGLFPEETVREWLQDGYVTRLLVRQACAWDRRQWRPATAEEASRWAPIIRRFLKRCLNIGA